MIQNIPITTTPSRNVGWSKLLPVSLAKELGLCWFAISFLLFVLGFATRTEAQVVISEIMYHPVEEPAFDPDGSPVLDLYEDVHEFVELHNVGENPVDLGGWELAGGIKYLFPKNTVIAAEGYVVVAKDPGRLSAVPAYNLAGVIVLGPYHGQLNNHEDTVRLRESTGRTVDSVSYSAEFPWSIGADALGADQEWTGLDPSDYQYRGRSLERVSFAWPGNDPANWLASPAPGNPSPGRPNTVNRKVPQPVVVRFSVVQADDRAAIIRSNQRVRMEVQFSGTQELSKVAVEWFVDDIDASDEPTETVVMSAEDAASTGRYVALLPGQPDRSVVRFRVRGDRGSGEEVISPRSDDPYRWHAYFVTPERSSPRPIYDCFISAASLNVLRANITQSPKRVTTPDPPGTPRVSWNATEPAILVADGVVYDIRMRYHGSRYNRSPNRNSFKWQFPRYRKFHGVTGIFETDKGNDFVVGHGLFRAVGLPVSAVRYVDLYLNDRASMQRLEQGEFDGDLLDEFHRSQQALNPGSDLEASGELYKDVGTIDLDGEGPYGRGDGRLLSKLPYWTDLQMYDWTYALQNHGWRGSYYWKQMIDAFWAARGDTPDNPNPDVPALRAFFNSTFDVDTTLTSLALLNWCCPFDDTTQNHFFWHRRNGKWSMLPWDDDAWFGLGDNAPATASIFLGEVGDPSNNFRGPNFFKDGFIKAFRQEFKERMFLLNNTFLHPDSLAAMGFGSIQSFARARMASVNEQCGLGEFQRPAQPVAASPSGGAAALPPSSLSASAYQHSAVPPRLHAFTTWEIRSSDGSYSAPVWKVRSSTNLTSTPIPFERLRLGQTYLWRCTYEDEDGHASVPSEEASFKFTLAASSSDVVLNEIGANNAGSVRNGEATPDWVELSNTGNQPVDLSGFSLSDNVFQSDRFVFPAGTLIGAHDYLMVWCDDLTDSPGLHTSFKLSDKGQTVTLYGPESPVRSVRDSITFGLQAADLSIGRVPDRTGEWQLTTPTPSVPNLAQTLATPAKVRINEWMAVPDSGDDWLELYNTAELPVSLGGLYLTDDFLNPTNNPLPALSFIGAHGFVKLVADQQVENGGDHLNYKLRAAGETIGLLDTDGVTQIDRVDFGVQTSDVSQGRWPDGGDALLFFPGHPTPGGPNRLPEWELRIVKRANGALVLNANGIGSGQVALQASADLSEWSNLVVRSAADGAFDYEDPESQSSAARYYRLLLNP